MRNREKMEEDDFIANEKSYATSRYKASHQKVNRNTRKFKDANDSNDMEDESLTMDERKMNEELKKKKEEPIEVMSEEAMLQKIFDKKNESESEESSDGGRKSKEWISDEEFKRQKAMKKNKHFLKKEKREREKNRKEE